VVVTQAALFGGMVGGRAGNIDIVSSLADGSVLASGKTDGDGRATIRVRAGGSVTAIYRHTVDLGADLITWTAVSPGDTLTFGNRNFATTGQSDTSIGTATYSWPAFSGASQYKVWTSCNTTGLGTQAPATSLTAAEFPACHEQPMTVGFSALDANNTLIGFGVVVSSAAFQDGATIQLPAWSPPATASITLTGLPSEISVVTGGFRAVIDGRFDINPGLAYQGAVTGGAFTASFPVSQLGVRTLGAATLNRTGFRSIQIFDALSLGAVAQTIAAPVLPPWSQNGTTASAGLRKATWVLEPSAASVYDGQALHMTWLHTTAGVPNASQWDILVPPGVSAVDFPALPAALADAGPAADDRIVATTRVFEIPSINGYATLRTMPSAHPMCLDCAVRTGDFPRVVFTQL